MIALAINVAVALLSFAYSAYSSYSSKKEMEKSERERQQTVFNQAPYPVVDASSPIPILYGCVQITGSNLVWQGRKHKEVSFKGPLTGSTVHENRYDIGLHLILCQSANYFWTLQINDVPVQDSNFGYYFPASSNASYWCPLPTGWEYARGGLSVYPNTKREQHVVAYEVLTGRAGQSTPRLFAEGALDNNVGYVRKGETGEAYRGIVSCVIGQPARTNPYGMNAWWGIRTDESVTIPDISVTLSNSGNEEIGHFWSANPAWIIEDFLTNPDLDTRISPAKIDRTSFDAAWDTLGEEEFGLNFLITDQAQGREFIAEVLRHIDGVIYQNRVTGKICLKLIREGDAASAPLLDESSIRLVTAYQRPDPFGLPTQQTIFYSRLTYQGQTTDNFDSSKKPDAADLGWKTLRTAVEAHDTAGTYSRGVVASQPQDFPGIISPSLAARVAQRELKTASTPRASIEFELNAGAVDDLYQGDLIRINWDELGLEEAVFRVLTVDLGTLTDGTVVITAIEDIFSFDANVIIEEPPTHQAQPAIPVINQVPFEVPLWLRRKTYGDYINVPNDDNADIALAAENPQGQMVSFLQSRNASLDGIESQFAEFKTIITAPLPMVKRWYYNSTLYLSGEFEPEYIGSYWIIRPASNASTAREIVQIVGYNATTGGVVVERGMLDTTTMELADGDRMWRIADADGKLLVPAERGLEIATFRGQQIAALTHTIDGNQLDWTDALKDTLAAFNSEATTMYRHQTEYPPKNLHTVDVGTGVGYATDIRWAYHDYLEPPRKQTSPDFDDAFGKTFQLIISGEASPMQGGIFSRPITVTSNTVYQLTHTTELSWNGLGRKSDWIAVSIRVVGSGGSRNSLRQVMRYER